MRLQRREHDPQQQPRHQHHVVAAEWRERVERERRDRAAEQSAERADADLAFSPAEIRAERGEQRGAVNRARRHLVLRDVEEPHVVGDRAQAWRAAANRRARASTPNHDPPIAPIIPTPSCGGAADLDRLVGLRALHQQREEAFLDALSRRPSRSRSACSRSSRAWFRRAPAGCRLRPPARSPPRAWARLPMPHARMLMPGRSAICLPLRDRFRILEHQHRQLGALRIRRRPHVGLRRREETERELRFVEIADVRNRDAVGAGIEDLLHARPRRVRAVLADRRDADDQRLAARPS